MHYFIIISINIVLLLLIAYFYSIKKPENKQMFRLDDEDFVKALLPFARQMRITEYGRGYNLASLYPIILQSYKQVERKVRADIALFEHEKWLYQNLYLVKRFVYSKKSVGFRKLPHSNSEVRIVALARFIVNRSLGALTPERIKLAMQTIQNEVSLCFEEIKNFNDAICYAIIEQIYILAQRVLAFGRNKNVALNGSQIYRKRMMSDIYNYYLLQNDKLKEQAEEILSQMGIKPQSITFNYNLSLTENIKMAEYLFTGLMNYNLFVTDKNILEYHSANTILAEDDSYKYVNLETKLAYYTAIEKISDKLNISEVLVARRLVDFAKLNKIDIGTVLFDYPYALKHSIKTNKVFEVGKQVSTKIDGCYIFVLAFLTVAFAVGVWWWVGSVAVAVVGVFPIFLAVEYLVNSLIFPYVPPKVLPQMNYQKIPSEHNTMVVVSHFLTSAKQVKEAVNHLIELKTSNIDENIQFALLADFKGGETLELDTDAEMLEAFLPLKDYDGCNVFLRKRVFDGKRFSGFERKRGAIMALNRYLVTGSAEEFAYVLKEDFRKPVFIMTLDADNTVVTGTIKDMINIMVHPYNQKYDLINAHSRYNLYSIKTKFAKRFLDSSGVNEYPMYTGLYYNLLGKDIFCGKGIYRLKEFYNKLEGVFPSKKILSHDIIEGALLKTGSGATIFEDAPPNFLTERERRKRWQRGDIQLLPFIGKAWKNDDKQVYNSSMGCFYKFLILRNAIGVLKETLIAIVALLALIINPSIWKFVVAIIAFPYVINQIVILQGFKNNIRLRYIAQKTINNIKSFFEDVFMLVYYAISNLILFVKTVAKMVARGNLLEWKTYYHSQQQQKFESYVQEFTPTIVVVAVVTLLLFVLKMYIPLLIFVAFGLLSYAVQLLMFLESFEFKQYQFTQQQQQLLLKYAEKTYKFFCLMNMPSGIIGDNFQIKPYKGQNRHTSPTNIGFTFIADIAAYYLGLIDKNKAVKLINNRLRSLDIMPKWNGNLYNWYSIDSLQPVNSFISSIDSGNLVASLLIVKSFLCYLGDSSGYELVDKLIVNTSLEALYDYEKSQFYIGYNQDSKEFMGHYDLLASESRLMSLIFIARTGRVEHWRKLQRDYTPLLGNTLLSWSGTMFEYLMSDHFIKPPRFSLLYSSSVNATKKQSKTMFQGLWGISESGYYAFDDHLRYQYHAFGINKLSLKNDYDRGIISPYSSCLALRYLKKEAVENLYKIESLGGFSEYGFFEAVDCEGKIRFINSHMTHHQGMILMAITNALKNDVFVELLKQNPSMIGSFNLLNEVKSQYSFGIKKANDNFRILKEDKEYLESVNKIRYDAKAFALTNGTMSVCFDTLGNNFVKQSDVYINAYRRVYEEYNGGYFYLIDEDGNFDSPSFYPLCQNINNHSISCSEIEITLQNTHKGIVQDVCVADGINAEVRRLSIKNNFAKNYKVAYYMDIALNDYQSFNAHAVFSKLFVHTSFDAEYNAVIMHKKALKKEGDIFVAFVIRGLKNLSIETNRYNILGRNGCEKNPLFFKNYNELSMENPSLGDVLEPAVGFIGEFDNNNLECQLITLVAKSKEELYSSFRILPEDFYSYAKESSRMKIRTAPIANRLLGALLYIPYSNQTLLDVWKNKQQKLFIETNKMKKSVLYIYEDTRNEYFIELINAIKLWNKLGVDIRLIISYKEDFKDTQASHITKQLESNFIYDYLLLERKQIQQEIIQNVFVVIDTDLTFNELKPRENVFRKINYTDLEYANSAFDKQECQQNLLTSGNGFFCQDAYVLMKKPRLPYSNVICDKYGGLVVTENGGGFFYFQNSRDFKINRFDFDAVKDTPLEYVFVKNSLGYHRINGGSKDNNKTIFKKGVLKQYCYAQDYYTCVDNYIIAEGKAKVSEVNINTTTQFVNFEMLYTLLPMLSWKPDLDFICMDAQDNMIMMYNMYNDKSCYIKVFCESADVNVSLNCKNQKMPFVEVSVLPNPNAKIFVVASMDVLFLNSLNVEEIDKLKVQSIEKFNNIGNIQLNSPINSFNYIANILLYQVYSSRISGKCGYYQTGGATGFRDQLQDSLAFLHCQPEIVKDQILYSAARQYEEGDVMHWWHYPRFGVRTKITDDKLFLPYVVSEYVEFTGDYAILDMELPYLTSPLLGEAEHSRLENPPDTDYRESIRKHCIRAIKSALRYGEHELLLLGGGDWNDGLDYAGIQGKGESVALSMFCYEVLMKFKQLCDAKTNDYFSRVATQLKQNINLYAYEDEQYKRLFTDDNKWLGAKNAKEYSLDLLAQSASVLYDIADKQRADKALKAAEQLVDKELGIIKLLKPPLTKENYLGYISSYPTGVRENGGQYTHASIWFIMALVRNGQADKAFELFQMINPVEKCRSDKFNTMYKGEPFVFSGDVYSNTDNAGRMGWSWYTGSAAWAYRLIFEEFYGLRKKNNNLVIQPSLPKKLINTEIIYKYNQSKYIIEFVEGKENSLFLDGVEVPNKIELRDKQRSKIIVKVKF